MIAKTKKRKASRDAVKASIYVAAADSAMLDHVTDCIVRVFTAARDTEQETAAVVEALTLLRKAACVENLSISNCTVIGPS
jgi:hypothetical protein